MIISLNDIQVADVDTVAKKFLNQTVYINWPHLTEAKVIQVFDSTKKFDGSNGENEFTQNTLDFNTCVDVLNSRFELFYFIFNQNFYIFLNVIIFI